jgi:hypothetical protein
MLEVLHCPEVIIRSDTIRIGEAANTVVLKKEEWHIIVDAIQAGHPRPRITPRGRPGPPAPRTTTGATPRAT